MADRYWVGGTGNWSSSSHWSATSGGGGGASVPTSADNVHFDGQSFSQSGRVVTIDGDASCRDMDWTGALNAPTLASGEYGALTIYGSLILVAGMSLNFHEYFALAFAATSTGKTVTMAGQVLDRHITFFGVGGGWTLQDALDVGNHDLSQANANALDFNGQAVSCGGFSSQTTGATTTLGASVITLRGTGTVWAIGSGVTLNDGTSTIKISKTNTTAVTFSGGGKTYSTLQITGSGNYATTIEGSNTFASLAVDTPPKTVKFTDGTTTTVTNFNLNGTQGNLITLTGTSTGGWTIAKAGGGSVFSKYLSVAHSTGTPSDTWNAARSTDGGNNSGWNLITLSVIGAALVSKLKAISALQNVYWFDSPPPAAITQFPSAVLLTKSLEYNQDFLAGGDAVADETDYFRVIVVGATESSPSGLSALSQFVDSRHASSIPAAVDSDPTLSGMVSEVHCLRNAGIDLFEWNATKYLSTEFEIRALA